MHIETVQTRAQRIFKKRRLKQICSAMLLFAVIMTTLFIFTPSAHAACDIYNPCGACEGTNWLKWRTEIEEKSGAICAWAFEVASTAANSNPHFNFQDIAANIYRFSTYDGGWTSLGGNGSLIDAGKNMYNTMSVIGICLIFLFFLIDLLDEVQADSFTIEHLIKKLLTLTVAIVVLDIGDEIFDYICQLGDALIDDAKKGTVNGNDAAAEDLYKLMMAAGDSGGLFSFLVAVLQGIGLVVDNVIPWILMLAAVIIAYLTGFSRFLEVLVRFAFAPIALAQLVSGGAKGPGMRYIKKFASVVIQGAVCVLAFGCTTILTNSASGLNHTLSLILVPVTLIGFLMKVGRIADDICGV